MDKNGLKSVKNEYFNVDLIKLWAKLVHFNFYLHFWSIS